jgi:methanogenic corrinoid protein MtbC1
VNDDHAAPALPPVDARSAGQGLADAYSPELLASLLADGDDDLAAWTIRHALAEGPRAEVYDGLVAGAMRIVGQRWSSGQWGIAEEHLASQTLLRALEHVRPDLGTEGRIGPLAVLAGAAGEHHMIGLVCLDHVLSEHGWTVANLGADLPPADLGAFVRRNDARLVAITASSPARRPDVAEAVTTIRGAVPQRLPVMLGGALGAQPGIVTTLDIEWAGSSLVDALRFADRVFEGLPAGEA